jgi:hypothetical protein
VVLPIKGVPSLTGIDRPKPSLTGSCRDRLLPYEFCALDVVLPIKGVPQLPDTRRDDTYQVMIQRGRSKGSCE